MILGENGEVVIQTFEDGTAILTVRQPEAERLAEVRMTREQANALSDILQRVPEPPTEYA